MSMVRIASILVCGPEHLIDVSKAIKYLLRASASSPEFSKGNADAQNMLGELYETGEGTESGEGSNLDSAIHYYKKAVSQGHSRAMFNLANLYEHGLGAKQDMALAIKLYKEVRS